MAWASGSLARDEPNSLERGVARRHRLLVSALAVKNPRILRVTGISEHLQERAPACRAVALNSFQRGMAERLLTYGFSGHQGGRDGDRSPHAPTWAR